jgi:hypothetical protein
MDQIYATSYLTVSLSTSSDANNGFLQQRNQLGLQSCLHTELFIPNGAEGHEISTLGGERTGPVLAPARRGICCGIPGQISTAHSVLDDRGWILQERVMARRLLHWSIYEISWECSSLYASERQPHGQLHKFDRPWWAANRDSPGTGNVEAYDSRSLRRVGEVLRAPDDPDSPPFEDEKSKGGLWHSLVKEFTRRELTFSSDRLPAMSGLSQAYAKAARIPYSDYYLGMWKGLFIQDLCWYRSGTPTVEAGWGLRDEKVPSFSWASLHAPVDFRGTLPLKKTLETLPRGKTLETTQVLSFGDDTSTSLSVTLCGDMFSSDYLADSTSSPFRGGKLIWDVCHPHNVAGCPRGIFCLSLGTYRADSSRKNIITCSFGLLLETAHNDESDRYPAYRRVGYFSFPSRIMKSVALEQRTVIII